MVWAASAIMSPSLSARRAWIEMLIDLVDSPVAKESLSARRAWIEITDPINLSDIPPSRSPQGERG